MNDEIERINQENRRLNKPSEGNQSRAAFSHITTNEQDSKNSMAENIILDLGNQRQDIDFLKETCKTLLNETNDIKKALNQITQVLNSTVQGSTNQASGLPEKGLNMESLSALGDLLEKGVSAYKNLKGSSPAPSFIDPEYINEQVKASVMGNFEIGNALISNLKSKLINKAVTASVTEALNDDKHAPQ